MSEPIRVLQINAGSKNFGGVSAFLYEVYKGIDKEKFQFDFLSPQKTTYEIYRKEIEAMGANIYELNIAESKKGITFLFELFFKTISFLKMHKYSIIHINSGLLTFNLLMACVAKLKGTKKIIVHSHNTKVYTNKFAQFRAKVEKKMIQWMADEYLACSILAAESMFPHQLVKENAVKIVKNGIEVEKFQFNQTTREEYRKQLDVEEKFVIGHVGRFVEQKNHSYLIDIFKQVYQSNKNAVLLLIGQGRLEESIKEKINQYQLQDSVKFLGMRKDIPQLMQAMDFFLFPSKYEGLGIVLIEAQAASLPTIASDVVPQETNITEYIHYASLEEEASYWKDEIETWYKKQIRRNTIEEVERAGYSIKATCRELEEIYNKADN